VKENASVPISNAEFKRLGKAVRDARGDKTLHEYSRFIGCSTSKLWNVEHGYQRPSIDDLSLWCRRTGIDAEVFYPEFVRLAKYFGPTLGAAVAVASDGG
jgi:transcriptional regulator with XRE-family HTH domain